MPVKVTPFSFIPEVSDTSRRLDDLIMARLPTVFLELGLDAVASKTKLRRLIQDGAVSVAGRPVRLPAIHVKPGTVITVYLDPSRFLAEKTPGDQPFECTADHVLYEDEWLIAINKPAGIPTEGSFLASRDSLHAAVRRFLASRNGQGDLSGSPAWTSESGQRRSEPFPPESCDDGLPYLGLPHRLDKDTTGIVLFTKHRAANSAVHHAFASRAAHKTYWALVQAPVDSKKLPDSSFQVTGLMARISPKSAAAKWGLVQSGGLPSSTQFVIETSGRNGLLLRAEPLTGRTHQIRVHAASVGLALYGDSLYGGPETFRGKAVHRVMLHAADLTIPHPADGRLLSLTAQVPEDFLQLRGLLGW